VESGRIGTSGMLTDLLRRQIIRSFKGQESLVAATPHDEDMPQSKRNSERRQAAKAKRSWRLVIQDYDRHSYGSVRLSAGSQCPVDGLLAATAVRRQPQLNIAAVCGVSSG
jgi:hypothetical protein